MSTPTQERDETSALRKSRLPIRVVFEISASHAQSSVNTHLTDRYLDRYLSSPAHGQRSVEQATDRQSTVYCLVRFVPQSMRPYVMGLAGGREMSRASFCCTFCPFYVPRQRWMRNSFRGSRVSCMSYSESAWSRLMGDTCQVQGIPDCLSCPS